MRRSFTALVFATLALGCSGAPAPRAGTEGGACFPNDTCNAGLTCLSTFCVRVVLPGADGGLDGGAGMDGAAGTDASGDGSVDAGPEVDFTPAAHPDLPQIGTLGGPVLVTPKVRPIIYANDASSTDIQAFLQELARTSYWTTATGEYGVGKLTVLPPIMIPSAAPAKTTDGELQSQLLANTSGNAPAWGVADPNVVYLYVVPPSATVDVGNATCCADFGGYHSETTTAGGVSVPYAVGCSCPGFFGTTVSPLDERTTAISHELVEAATDPFPVSNPAYEIEDRADIVWTVINGGGEVGDMCAFNDDAYVIPAGSTYMVQRTWSNAAAKKMQNPCVPSTTGLYFNSFPALDPIMFTSDRYATRGLQIPLGQSRTIDVNLYSNAPTKGPWTVTAVDYDAWFFGRKANLKLSLDKNTGRNGDTLHLTVTPMSADSNLQGEVFILYSSYGTVRDPDYQTNLTASLVIN
jgi:hypothetical protein